VSLSKGGGEDGPIEGGGTETEKKFGAQGGGGDGRFSGERGCRGSALFCERGGRKKPLKAGGGGRKGSTPLKPKKKGGAQVLRGLELTSGVVSEDEKKNTPICSLKLPEGK